MGQLLSVDTVFLPFMPRGLLDNVPFPPRQFLASLRLRTIHTRGFIQSPAFRRSPARPEHEWHKLQLAGATSTRRCARSPASRRGRVGDAFSEQQRRSKLPVLRPIV